MSLLLFRRNRGHYTIPERARGSEKSGAALSKFVMAPKLFCGLCRGLCRGLGKGYVSDAAGEKIATSDMACGIPAENDSSAKRALEFAENGWFEDGGLLPVLSALNAKQSFLPAVAFQSRTQCIPKFSSYFRRL